MGKFSKPVIYKKYQPLYNLVLDSEYDTTSFSNYVSGKRLAIIPGSVASELRQNCNRARNGLGGFTILHYYNQNELAETGFTIEKDDNVDVYIYYYTGETLDEGGDNGSIYNYESFRENPISNHTNENTIKEAIIISLCEDLSVTSWSIKITSDEHISKTYTVSRNPIQLKSDVTKLQIEEDLSSGSSTSIINNLSSDPSINLSAYQNDILVENSDFSESELFFRVEGLNFSNRSDQSDIIYPLFCLSRGTYYGYSFNNPNSPNKVNLSFSKRLILGSVYTFTSFLNENNYDATNKLSTLIKNGTAVVFYLIPKYEVSTESEGTEDKLLNRMVSRNGTDPNIPYVYKVSEDFDYPIKAKIIISLSLFGSWNGSHSETDSGWMVDKSNIYYTKSSYTDGGDGSSTDRSGTTNLTYNEISLSEFSSKNTSSKLDQISITPKSISVISDSSSRNLIEISTETIDDGNNFILGPRISLENSINSSKIELDGSGDIKASGSINANATFTSSDVRLKSNITDLEDRGSLRPVSYIKDGKEGIGFIAQEVQEKYPELVSEDSSTENHYLYLNYPQITAVLQAQVNTLREEIEILKEEIKQLKKNK